MDELRKIPPVTRSLLGATGILTVPCLLAIMSPYRIALVWPLVTRRFELQRLLTSFFYGGQGLPFLFDSFLLFRNSSDLELNHFSRRTADYVWCLLIMATAIHATNYPLQSMILFSPMLNALTYLWSRTNPHGRVSFFGFITIPAPWLPYAYLFMDLVRGGPALMLQSATGIISAHLYWLLAEIWPATNGGRGPRLVDTPAFLRRLLPDSQDPSMAGRNMGDRQGRNTGYGSAWNAASSGQRLGQQAGPRRDSVWSSIRRVVPSPSWGGLGTWRRGGASGAAASGPDREAMLAAAERRLRAQQANSIVGRNLSSAASSSGAAAAAAAPKPQPAGSESRGTSTTSSTSVNARAANPSASAAVRRTAAASGQTTGVFSFGQLNIPPTAEEEGEEDHSSSGGRVAEKRRKAPTPDDGSDEDQQTLQQAKQQEGGGYQWGGAGRKLGE